MTQMHYRPAKVVASGFGSGWRFGDCCLWVTRGKQLRPDKQTVHRWAAFCMVTLTNSLRSVIRGARRSKAVGEDGSRCKRKLMRSCGTLLLFSDRIGPTRRRSSNSCQLLAPVHDHV